MIRQHGGSDCSDIDRSFITTEFSVQYLLQQKTDFVRGNEVKTIRRLAMTI